MLRKSLIYKTKVPGGDYALNHALGCSHGCAYPCFAYVLARRRGTVSSYGQWVDAQIVENGLELLDHELPKLAPRIRNLHLGLSMDPFMVCRDDVCQMSVEILRRASSRGVPCSVLSKGVYPASLADLSSDMQFGISVVTLNEDFRRRYEPGASPIHERISALRTLHERGAYTYAHIAPYPTPNMIRQSLPELLEAVGFVDHLMFGRLNYSPLPDQYGDAVRFYEECRTVVDAFRQERGIASSGHRPEKAPGPSGTQLSFFDS